MAGTVCLTNAFISWKGTNLSAKCRSLTLTYESEVQDGTAFTDGTRIRKGGLKVWGVEAEFYVDESTSGGVNASLFPDVGTTGTLLVKPTTGAVSSTNPSYSGTAILANFGPLGGTVGEIAVGGASFQSSGTLTRTTT